MVSDWFNSVINYIAGLLSFDVFWIAIQAIATALTLIYLAQQNISMRKSLSFDIEWRKKEKASELASFYAQSILPRLSYITEIYQASGALPLLSKIATSGIKSFDISELELVFPDYAVVDIKIRNMVDDISTEVFLASRALLPSSAKGSLDNNMSIMLQHKMLVREFWTVQTGLLNDLEYFSMCVNSDLLDKDFLYQLVAKSYIDVVQICYFYIAIINKEDGRKFYNQICCLYNQWERKFSKQTKSKMDSSDK